MDYKSSKSQLLEKCTQNLLEYIEQVGIYDKAVDFVRNHNTDTGHAYLWSMFHPKFCEVMLSCYEDLLKESQKEFFEKGDLIRDKRDDSQEVYQVFSSNAKHTEASSFCGSYHIRFLTRDLTLVSKGEDIPNKFPKWVRK